MKRRLGSTELMVSPLGFGCYRVDEHTPAQREALEAALDGGVNLIDTSTNYTDGSSERLVGTVIAGRPEVVVVSKLGYVQGTNLRLARERKLQGRPFPEMVEYAPGCWHCLHPEFLEDQLARSLERLGRMDVCLLHNPEYFLMEAGPRGQDVKPEFYRRLKEAFAYLETQVQAGRIRAYGVSSNTVADPDEDPSSTNLQRMLDAAGPSFRVLQLPMNLVESEGALGTTLQEARQADLGVLINRPLNAFMGRSLLRLADPPALGGEPEEFPELLERLEELERDPVRIAHELQTVAATPLAYSDWMEVEQNQIWPYTLDQLDRMQPPDPPWREEFLQVFHRVLLEIRRRSATISRGRNAVLHAKLPDHNGATLSQKALWTLLSTPGVTSVLLGMRRHPYVEDALPVMSWAPMEDPLAVYRRFASTS